LQFALTAGVTAPTLSYRAFSVQFNKNTTATHHADRSFKFNNGPKQLTYHAATLVTVSIIVHCY